MDLILPRKKIFKLEKIDITNKEWLYMIKNDTRHSLQIEGIVSSEKDLKSIIKGNYDEDDEIVNYFSTAKHMYSYAIEYYKDNEFALSKATIRQIQKQLLSGSSNEKIKGVFRNNNIDIHYAPNINPPENDIDFWVENWINYVNYSLKKYNIYQAMARIHNYFEGIHPFNDGNGRTGRIVMNYILLMKGYPNIVIKGLKENDRKEYYKALEKGDVGINQVFKTTPNKSPQEIDKIINKGNFEDLEQLIKRALIESFDNYICMEENDFYTTEEVAKILNKKQDTISKDIRRGNLIAKKQEGKWYIPKKYFNILNTSKSAIKEKTKNEIFYYTENIDEAFNYSIGVCLNEEIDLEIAVENQKLLKDLKDLIDTEELLKNKETNYNKELKIRYITPRKQDNHKNSLLLAIKISPKFFNKIKDKYNYKIIVIQKKEDKK
ncbi:Fic family protein [Geotoga petraea]|uniref:Fic family protein n=1 Tax=Geotoga petraea TaxID=28234 RepID=A0A1G6PLV6_9BACT|nr:Fic family protein [Geotoga petraea]SDC80604.1 Fic family protein [Geotoga petraea]